MTTDRELIERLKGALEPFAQLADANETEWRAYAPNDEVTSHDSRRVSVDLGSCRRARAALSGETNDPK